MSNQTCYLTSWVKSKISKRSFKVTIISLISVFTSTRVIIRYIIFLLLRTITKLITKTITFLFTKNDRKFCHDHGVLFVAFSPLGSPDLPWGEKLPHILADPIINKVYCDIFYWMDNKFHCYRASFNNIFIW